METKPLHARVEVYYINVTDHQTRMFPLAPVASAQIQRYLGLRNNPVFTLSRMVKVGILAQHSCELYAYTAVYVELMKQHHVKTLVLGKRWG